MAVQVLQPGILTTLQDLGRTGFRSQGVVCSGAMDTFAHNTANWLAGNETDCATLEITMGSLQLLFEQDCHIAVTGPGIQVFINNHPVNCWQPLHISSGNNLHIQYTGKGCRAYLAVYGGWKTEPVLNSYSTYLPAGWGGYKGRSLLKGDLLLLNKISPGSLLQKRWSIAPAALPFYSTQPQVRVVKGAEWELFTDESKTLLLQKAHPVLPQSNRMGYRLQCSLKRISAGEMLSAAVCPGTIQALPDGNMVLLMRDSPATGGYPRIGQVLEADLSLPAQLVSGNTIRFKEVSPDEAEEIYLNYQTQMGQLKTHILNRLY